MKTTYFTIVLAYCFLLGSQDVLADPNIYIRLSFKVVLNPVNGQRPNDVTNQVIENTVNEMNARMDTYWRGYRFTLVEILDVGNQGGYNNGPSQWYSTDFFNEPGAKDEMEGEAKNNVSAYRWRTNAINLYVTTGFGGGICSFGSDDDEIIILDDSFVDYSNGVLHEIGHYFNLYHTHHDCDPCLSGNSLDCLNNCNENTCNSNDDVSDTLKDHPCWDFDEIVLRNGIATPVSNQNAERVNTILNNLMSYHHISNPPQSQSLLTEGQLDRWAGGMDNPNYPNRINVRTGKSFLAGPGPNQFGGSFITLFLLFTNPNGGDIIYLDPGIYQVGLTYPLTIDQPITLRATREGPAIIGQQ